MAKHTPGPWKAEGQLGLLVAGPADEKIAILHGERINPDTEGNVRLITAAPDLLEVMLDLFSNTQFRVAVGGNPHRVDDLLSRARSAIAKATGGTDEQD